MGIGIKETDSTTQLFKQSRCESEKTRTNNYSVMLNEMEDNYERLKWQLFAVINIYNKEFQSKLLKFYGFLFCSKFFLMYVLYVYILKLYLFFETCSKVMLNFL